MSAAVEKIWLCFVGMVVLRSISLVATPPMVSMDRDRGVTSSSRMSPAPASPASLPPCKGPKHFDMNLSRAQFDELTHDLVEKTAIPVQNAMKDAGLTNADLGQASAFLNSESIHWMILLSKSSPPRRVSPFSTTHSARPPRTRARSRGWT